MGYIELDTNLSKESQAMHREVLNFATQVMRPAGTELDKLHDPADVIAKGSALWDVFKAYREHDLHMMSIPKALGGMAEDMDPATSAVISETLGYGDAGLAISLGASGFPFYLASLSEEPELQELARAYCEDTKAEMVGCWAITEPAHGSDWVFGTNPNFDDPRCAPDVRAELKGDEYIINGQKSAWVSNGTIATHAALHVCLDPAYGMQGGGLAVIPLDLPGIKRGRPLDKIGQRALNQGEIFFDEVKIPKKYMVIADRETMTMTAKLILTAANGGMGLTFVGLGQAVFDETLAYAKQRIQGGVPIFEHKNIKWQLFNMFTKIEASRALARRQSNYNAVNLAAAPHYAVASKVMTTRSTYEVASEAISIFGGNGLAREYPIEKMFRDARAAMVEDGENNALSISSADDLT